MGEECFLLRGCCSFSFRQGHVSKYTAEGQHLFFFFCVSNAQFNSVHFKGIKHAAGFGNFSIMCYNIGTVR